MDKKFLVSIFVFLILINLTGCAPTFIPPMNGPTAQLAVRNPSSVSVAVFDDAIQCKGGPRGIYPLFKPKTKFVTIPASKPLSILVITNSDFSERPEYDTVTFIPQTGKKYTVVNSLTKKPRLAYRLQILKTLDLKNGKSKFIPIRFIKRNPGFIAACDDKDMMENIRGITELKIE